MPILTITPGSQKTTSVESFTNSASSYNGHKIVPASHHNRRADKKNDCALGGITVVVGLIVTIIGAILWGVGAGVHNHACLNTGITFFSTGLAVVLIGGFKIFKSFN